MGALVKEPREIEYSRFSSEYLAGRVQQEYGLPMPVHCRLIAPERVLYEIRWPAGRAILRVHETLLQRLPALPRIGFQYELARFLAQAGLPVSSPTPRRDGSLFGILHAPEGDRCFGLWSYACGDSSLTIERAQLLGKTLARVHMAADAFQPGSDALRFDLDSLLHEPQGQIGRFFTSWRNEDVRFLNEILGPIKDRLGQCLSDLPPRSFGPIWGDANGSNQHFTPGNDITIFDFEFAGLGWRLYDLATFRWARDRAMKDREGLWRAFLGGYESDQPLRESEKRLIPHFVLLRHIEVLASTVAEHIESPEMAPVFLTVPERWDRAFSNLREIAAAIDPPGGLTEPGE